MIRITIGNSYSRVEGLDKHQFYELREILSYRPNDQKSYFRGSKQVFKTYLIGIKGDFPTGLLYLTKKYLKDHKLSFTIKDTRTVPESFIGGFDFSLPLTPYQEQIDVSKAALERHRGIISAPTGTGKTVMAALIINELQVTTLIVVPSLELKRQLLENFKAWFGNKFVGSLEEKAPITIENVDSLDPNVEIDYDCVIIDEFQHSAAKTYRLLNKKAWKNVYYRFGITATPFRTRDEEQILLESILSEVIYKLDYKTAVKKGYITPIEAYYVEIPKSNYEGYSYGEVYKELFVDNDTRNSLIAKVIQSLWVSNKSSLILVNQIEHGERLKQISWEKNGIYVSFANGQDTSSKRMIQEFNEHDFPVLIGSQILGEGVDTKPCEWVVLAGGSGKSRGALMQAVGRAVRKYPGKESAKVISFYDPSHKWFKKHHAFFIKTMKEEYGVVPIKIKFDDYKKS